ncbi:MAG TPA: hydrogenase [Thermoplasmata archaeon]|nr:hydrogenase [Thermoplasmata archaeon]
MDMEDFLKELASSLKSGFGFWNPLLILLAFGVALLIVYYFWRTGNQSYQRRTMQTQPFFSGNALPDPVKGHVPADNLFWGFKHALRGYYQLAERAHNGLLNDYAAWFVVVFAFILIAITMGGA